MYNAQKAADRAIELMLEKGADKCSVSASSKERREFNVDGGKFSLFRTLFDNSLSLITIKNGKKGSIRINRFDEEAIANAVSECLASADAGQADEAWDIAPKKENKNFESGCLNPDIDKFFSRLQELMGDIGTRHKTIMMEQLIAEYAKSETVYKNSNGVCFEEKNGCYVVELMFSAHEGEKCSSFFGNYVLTDNLDKPFIELGSIEKDLSDVEKQIETRSPDGKFVGTAISTPSALMDMIDSALNNFAGGRAVLDKTAIWLDKLDKKVADEKLTVAFAPHAEGIVCGDNYTSDGFLSEDYRIIDKGVLKSFMLDLYLANKTGFSRAPNDSNNMVVDAGDTPLDDIIKGIERGIVVGRFSGGEPAGNGDFSGVAKNSFLIENGKITTALSETMINGNLADMLMNIRAISKERVCDGSTVLPWVAFDGITISGK